MKKNIGKADRIIRIALSIVFFALGYYYHSWWGLIGFVPFLTSLIGWCPIYAILGLNTCNGKFKKDK